MLHFSSLTLDDPSTNTCHICPWPSFCHPLAQHPCSHQLPLQGLLNFLVAQTVDEGVKERGNHRVDHCQGSVIVKGVTFLQPHIHEEDATIEDENHSEVGGTCGEVVHFDCSRRNPELFEDYLQELITCSNVARILQEFKIKSTITLIST